MSTTSNRKVEELDLDLENFRHLPQSTESDAINALINLKPEKFWGLMHSLLDEGYLPTENIIVLKNGDTFVVKEGNRRIAALKILLGHVTNIEIPDDIGAKIATLPDDWKTDNATVPCTTFAEKDSAKVAKIVSLTHGKNEAAARDPWGSVARARQARAVQKKSEPGLDLLELWLIHGKNHSAQQADRWAGEYNLTVLDEVLPKLAQHLGCSTSAEVVASYPKKNRKIVEAVLLAIGLEELRFAHVRDQGVYWGIKFGLPDPKPVSGAAAATTASGSAATTSSGAGAASSTAQSSGSKPAKKSKAVALEDPRSVRRRLRQLHIHGKNRERVVTLVEEMWKLKLDTHPNAFCFVLRSCLELSAKAFCQDHANKGLTKLKNSKGQDLTLLELLKALNKFIVGTPPDKTMQKKLNGAMVEFSNPNGLLSITSLNHLVHNTSYAVGVKDICHLFHRVFPMLEELNI